MNGIEKIIARMEADTQAECADIAAQAAAEAEERLLEAAGQWPGREGDGLVPELMEFLEREKMAPDRNGPGR